MWWWFNVYSPQTHWPLSGAVSQDIAPPLLAMARDSRTERRVLAEVASYGRQLGVLSDLLLDVAEGLPPERLPPRGRRALGQLQEFARRIEALKDAPPPGAVPAVPDDPGEARALLRALRARHPQIEA